MSTLKRLLKLLAPFRGWILLAVLLSFATTASTVGLMAMSAYLISKSALITDVTELALVITAVRFFAIARAALRYSERIVTHSATFRILTHLRVWFYNGLEPLAPARLQQYRSGDLLTRSVADIETLENFYIRAIVPPIAAALVTIFACLLLGSFDIWLGVMLLFFLLITGVGLPLASRWLSQQPAAALIAARAELNATLVDEIQGIPDLLAFVQEEQHLRRARELSWQLNDLQERMAMLRGLGNGLAALFTSLAGLAVLGLAIPLVTRGQIQGVYLALLPLAAIASFEAVQPLSQAFQTLEASQVAASRLFELIDMQPAVVDLVSPSPAPVDTSLEIRNLCFQYQPDEPPALDGLSFSVPSGGWVSIAGPSGAGKSTLVNLLLRFWDYQAGEIRLGGHDLHAYQAEDVRRLWGVVSQETHLFNGTLRDNLWLADPDASEEQLVEACRQAQVHDFISGLPLGYDTLIGENGLLLSGGERQRLAIARVFLKNAPLLILDEPTTHLDAVTEQAVMGALKQFMQGRTTLLISHRPIGISGADQVIALEYGRRVDIPSPVPV